MEVGRGVEVEGGVRVGRKSGWWKGKWMVEGGVDGGGGRVEGRKSCKGAKCW